MTSTPLRTTSLLAVTASAAAMAFAAPATADQPPAGWRVAQNEPQLTDEEKKRLDELKKHGGQPRQPPPGQPNTQEHKEKPADGKPVAPNVIAPKIVPKVAPKVATPPPPPDIQQKPVTAPIVKPDIPPAKTVTPPPKIIPPHINPSVKTETPPVVNNPPTGGAPIVKTEPPVKTDEPPATNSQTESAPANKGMPRVRTLNPSTNPAPKTNDAEVDKKPVTPTLPPANTTTQTNTGNANAPANIKPFGGGERSKPFVPVVKNLEQAKTTRVEKVEDGGKRVVIREADKRTIVKQGDKVVIQKDETVQLQRVAPNAIVTRGKLGSNTVVVNRPNNVQIITETDRNGQLLRRYRRDGAGHETEIIDNRRRKNNFGRNLAIGVGIGAGIVAGAAILNSVVDVPPPVVRVPREKYIVRYEDASEEDVYEALSAPPIDTIEQRYTLDQVRATPYLRDRMRRIDLDDINFEFGSWEVDPSEYRKLERIARAMLRVIDRNPNEVFLIEGYTDAVGSDVDNLTLSDRRAESVSVILSEQFQVPFENLTTQGYGEQYLKVQTDGPERANRRVAVRRITPLLAQEESDAGPPPPPRRYEDRDDPDRYRGRRWRHYGRYGDY